MSPARCYLAGTNVITAGEALALLNAARQALVAGKLSVRAHDALVTGVRAAADDGGLRGSYARPFGSLRARVEHLAKRWPA